MSFIERLRKARGEVLARNADTWRIRLERVRGKIGDDGIERVSTQTLFDLLEIPQRSRTAGACRRLAALMRVASHQGARADPNRREGSDQGVGAR